MVKQFWIIDAEIYKLTFHFLSDFILNQLF